MRTFNCCFSLRSHGYFFAFSPISKSIILSFMLIIGSGSLMAQIKIGDNPHIIDDGSLIEMESNNRALVIPRMTSAERDM